MSGLISLKVRYHVYIIQSHDRHLAGDGRPNRRAGANLVQLLCLVFFVKRIRDEFDNSPKIIDFRQLDWHCKTAYLDEKWC